jgi:hypothetical protein
MSKTDIPLALLASLRPSFATKDKEPRGPFLAMVTSREPYSASDLEALVREADALAYACLWPRTWFSMPDLGDPPIFRSVLSGGSVLYSVDYTSRLEAYEHAAGLAAARLPDLRPEREPAQTWTAFVFGSLKEAKLLRYQTALEGRAQIAWYPADGFAASLAALDWLAERSGQPPAQLRILPEGFVYQEKTYRLTGKPLAMLRELLAANDHCLSARQLQAAVCPDEELPASAEQAVRDTVRKLRKALWIVVRNAGQRPSNHLPSAGKGENLSYRLSLPERSR